MSVLLAVCIVSTMLSINQTVQISWFITVCVLFCSVYVHVYHNVDPVCVLLIVSVACSSDKAFHMSLEKQ